MITSDQRTRLLIASATASLAGCCVYYRRRAHYIAALEQVLDFWFDPTKSSDDLYDQKWFVAANSQAQAALDEEVRKRFGSLLADASSIRLFVPATARTTLALIVLLDQLSRHAFRSDRDQVESNDKLALQLTQKLLARGWEATLSTAELVFALMPLRHQPNEARLRDVLDRTAPALASCESGARLLQRFRKHTHLRLLHLEGKQGDPDDILEREDRERELDQIRAPTEPLARCVDSFLRQHCGVVPSADGKSDSASTNVSGARREQKARRREELMSKVRGGGDAAVDVEGHVPSAAASTDAPLTLIVSLSGGVDSMALVHILLALKAKHGYSYTVHAVHIDYANRRESAAEASFVREWCEARGVSIQVRVVEEVKRGITARDEYERRSREIRFGEYERAMAATGGRGVFFGHHEGDGEQLVFPSLSVFSPLSVLLFFLSFSTPHAHSFTPPLSCLTPHDLPISPSVTSWCTHPTNGSARECHLQCDEGRTAARRCRHLRRVLRQRRAHLPPDAPCQQGRHLCLRSHVRGALLQGLDSKVVDAWQAAKPAAAAAQGTHAMHSPSVFFHALP